MTSDRAGRLRYRLLLAVGSVLAALLPSCAATVSGDARITVMTQNLYVGTPLNDVFGALSWSELVAAGDQAWANLVASDFPEIRRVVNENDIGLLFDPETPGALAAALGRLVADAELRSRLAGNARASARARSGEAQEAGLVGLYERVLALSSPRS